MSSEVVNGDGQPLGQGPSEAAKNEATPVQSPTQVAPTAGEVVASLSRIILRGLINVDSIADKTQTYNPDEWCGKALTEDGAYVLPPWVIEGGFRQAYTFMFPGDAGAGKTALALDMLNAIDRGEPEWLGMKIAGPGSALFISEDAAKTDVVDMYKRIGGRFHLFPRLKVKIVSSDQYGKPSWNVNAMSLIVEHCKTMRERGRPVKVIVIDSLASAVMANINDNQIAQFTTDTLRHIAEMTGAAVGVLHHPTKTDLRSGKKQDFSGGYQLKAGIDFLFKIEKGDEFEGGHFLTLRFDRARAALRQADFVIRYTYRDQDGTPIIKFERESLDPNAPRGEAARAVEFVNSEGTLKNAAQIGEHLWPAMKAGAPRNRKVLALHLDQWLERKKDKPRIYGPCPRPVVTISSGAADFGGEIPAATVQLADAVMAQHEADRA